MYHKALEVAFQDGKWSRWANDEVLDNLNETGLSVRQKAQAAFWGNEFAHLCNSAEAIDKIFRSLGLECTFHLTISKTDGA